MVGLSGKFLGSTLGDALRSAPVTLPDGSRDADLPIEPERSTSGSPLMSPATPRTSWPSRSGPVTTAALADEASEPGWENIPSWAVVATQARNIPARAQIFMAQHAHAHITRVRASHAVSVPAPPTSPR
ncbi:hypothetical protein ACIGMX_38760 [Streptomyces aquilus]|uniref:Uncharacterized protein n=1 Tax=Streptomyces aquilus TaxID=2548456 RepID=A0A3S9HS67_9ACTN|nr:hypothetical protein EJC51_01730 [Streptomyces aquilus]